MIHFNGDRALSFVRSRNFSTGDLERIQNQQKFIAAAIDKIVSKSTFFQPARIRALADVARHNLVIDQHTTIRGLADIGQKLRDLNPDTYEAYTVPNLGSALINFRGADVSIVKPDVAGMRVMFRAIRDNESPAEADGVPGIDPATIRVGVYNGVGLERAVAAPAADELTRATTAPSGRHVRIVDVANAKRFGYRTTTIVYNSQEPEAKRMAALVAAAIPGADVAPGKTKRSVDVAVIVGRRGFRTRRITQIVPIPIPEPGALPAACRIDSKAPS
jgi:hypothetical protein